MGGRAWMTAAVAVLAFACGALPEEHASGRLKVTLRRPDDQCQVVAEQGRTTLRMESPFGISRAVIERQDERWPAEVVVRLHLRGLEHFRVSNGTATLQGAAGVRDSKPDVRLWKDDRETEPLPRSDPLWTEVRVLDGGEPAKAVPLRDGCFELRLPAGLFQGNPRAITLEWIDFYR